MKKLFTIFFFCLSFVLKAQNLIISSGLYHSQINISMLDRRSGSGVINSKTSYPAFDFNILLESKKHSFYSFKSGIYLHKTIYNFTVWNLERVPEGTLQWTSVDQNYVMPDLIVPLLLSYTLKDNNKDNKLRIHIDAGLFLDYRLLEYYESYDFYKLNIGGEILAGIGTNKWQLNCYLMNSFRNMIKPASPLNLEKTKGFILGVNLTRIINLKRKSYSQLSTSQDIQYTS